MSDKLSPRVYAIQVLLAVIGLGRSLDRAEDESKIEAGADRALARSLVYGVLRNYYSLTVLVAKLLERPLKQRDQDVFMLLLIGIFQIQEHRAPDYAVVSETVNAVKGLSKSWAKGLVNAVLRSFIRQQQHLLEQSQQILTVCYAAPEWFIERLQQDWPEHWQIILQANNKQAPMVLRVNGQQVSRQDYLKLLNEKELTGQAIDDVATAIKLTKACDVEQLPGFQQGLVSVQDAAAQWAAPLLNPQSGQRVLDACAAPGGKTLHLLEFQPGLSALHALDCSDSRSKRIHENLSRLMPASECVQVKVADAGELSQWWGEQAYDQVLLDAPCSGTGVIRRHPDIQILRRSNDIESLQQQQWRLLSALWQTVAVGGKLLYCTCSVLKAENEQIIQRFLEEFHDAQELPIAIPGVLSCSVGVQFLPGVNDTDGFYYALLLKQAV